MSCGYDIAPVNSETRGEVITCTFKMDVTAKEWAQKQKAKYVTTLLLCQC